MVDEHGPALHGDAGDLEAIERLAAVGTWRLDLRTGENTWSPGLYRLMGEPETFVPTAENRWQMCHPDDRHLLDAARTAIDRGEPFRLRYRIVRPDGAVRWILNTAEPIRDRGGAPLAYRGVVRDVTTETEYHASLERDRRRLMEAQAVARVGHWDWDILTNRIEWSDETFRIFGVTPDTFEVSYPGLLEMIPEEDRRAVTDGVAAALDGKAPYRARHRAVRSDGTTVVVMERGEVVRDALGSPVRMLGTAQDITEQARNEATLRQREQQLRRAQEIGEVGDWVWDFESRTVTWSEQMYRIYGLDPAAGQPSQEAIAEQFHPDDRGWVVAEQRRAVMEGASEYEMQHRIIRPNGEIRWVHTRAEITRNAAGRVVHMHGVNHDITDRAQTETALRLLTDSLAKGEELARLGSYQWARDSDDLWWSDQMYALYGYERHAVTPTFALALAHMRPEEREAHDALVRTRLRDGDGWDVEYHVRTVSGEERIMRDRAEILRGPDGRVRRVHGTLQDITERAQTEARLRRLSESLARGEQMARVGTYEWDAAADTLWWSDELYRIFGLDPGSVVPSHAFVLSHAHADDRAAIRQRVADGMREGTGWDLVYRIHDAAGATHVIREVAIVVAGQDGKPGRVYGSAQDITEQARLRERVEAQAQEVLSIITASPLPIVVIEENGTIVRANPATERAFGWSDAELRGGSVATLAANVSPAQHARYLSHYLATGESSTPEGLVIGRTREVRGRRKDGTEFPAQLTVAEASGPTGERRFVGIMMDLTEQKATEQHLLQLQKTEALGTLVAGVAHDFNNLLTAIRGGIEMAQRHPQDERWLSIADQATTRATDLVRQLLRFSRRGETARATLAPATIVSDTAALVRDTLDRRIWFDVALEEGLPAIEGDAGQLQQVLMNLIVNARDAVLDRALVSGGDYRPEVYLRAAARAHEGTPGVAIEVVDNGVGMSEEVQARALDPFFTTKPVDRGTGLGLSMAAGIVQQHGGRIIVESVEGAGTTCRIWLPARSVDLQAPVAATVAAPESDLPGTVLVVDDELSLAEVSAAFLEAAGYEAVIANGGAQAIDLFRTRTFDLVVLDLNMPRPNGWEVLEAVREYRPGFPVLMVSGYLNPEEAARRGVSFLPKPFRRDELVQAVQRVLHEHRAITDE